jgi:hypothetical protein
MIQVTLEMAYPLGMLRSDDLVSLVVSNSYGSTAEEVHATILEVIRDNDSFCIMDITGREWTFSREYVYGLWTRAFPEACV